MDALIFINNLNKNEQNVNILNEFNRESESYKYQ